MDPPDVTGELEQSQPTALPDRKKSAYRSFRNKLAANKYKQLGAAENGDGENINQKRSPQDQRKRRSGKGGSGSSPRPERPPQPNRGAPKHNMENQVQGAGTPSLLIDLNEQQLNDDQNRSHRPKAPVSLIDSSIAEKYGYLPVPLNEKRVSPDDPFEVKQDILQSISQLNGRTF